MFSRRTAWPIAKNPLTSAVEARRAAGLPLIDLTLTNPTQTGLDLPFAEIEAALQSIDFSTYQPDSLGSLAARLAVAAHHQQAVPAENIVLSASTSEAYGWLFKLLCNPGDRILTPQPSYPLLQYLAQLENVEMDTYCAHYADGWHIDIAQLQHAWTPQTRAVVVVTPNNPTGCALSPQAADAISQFCAEKGLALICDEVFADTLLFQTDKQKTLASNRTCLTFVLSGLSKVCLLPQCKLGWTLVCGPADLVRAAMQRLEIIADTWLSVATPIQHALPALLRLRPQIQLVLQQRLAQNDAQLQIFADRTAVSVLRADGGWTRVLQLPRVLSDENWALYLLDAGVLLQPGYYFDFDRDDFLVLSLLPPPDVFARGLAIVSQCVAQAVASAEATGHCASLPTDTSAF